MKKTLIILSIFAFIASSCNQATKKQTAEFALADSNTPIEQEQAQGKNKLLKETIIKTIKAWQNKDEKTLNSLILKDFGIAFLYKPGALNRLALYDKVLFDNPEAEYSYMPSDFHFETDYKINFEELPDFDCETEKWNKPLGIYCDTINIDKKLSTTAKDMNEFLELNQFFIEDWSASKIKKFEDIECKSHKIVVTGKEYNVFAFYLTFIGNQWYLTVIDRLEPCSA